MTDDSCAVCHKDQDNNAYTRIDWISCAICDKWYHAKCVDVHRSDLNRIKEFHCPTCAKIHGPSVMTRTSSRAHKKIDYIALNEGEDVREVNRHPHIDDFNSFQNDESLQDLVYLVDPAKDGRGGIVDDEQLMKIILKTKLKKPILVRNCNPSVKANYDKRYRLSFQFPRLSIDELTELIGDDTSVPVMDVQTQNNSPKWDMARWRDYFKESPEDREKILNVISLEFSQTPLADLVELPGVVSKIDIVTRLFGSAVGERLQEAGIERPKVTKYVLMSVADSFTDFHIDFAGTSVYYTIMSGHKQFLMYPPTEKNLNIYRKWCDSTDQGSLWLGDLIPKLSDKEILKLEQQGVDPAYVNNGIKIDINAGDLLLLPSGWIHSVYTPSDSLIIGGNFLNLLSLENHLKTYQIEIETKVPDKFKFPDFVRILWLIGWYLVEDDPPLNKVELECLGSLDRFYKTQWAMVNDRTLLNDKKMKRVLHHVKQSLPTNIIGPPGDFVSEFSNWYAHQLDDNHDQDHGIPSYKRLRVS